MLKFLNTAAIFIIPVLVILIIFMFLFIIYIMHKWISSLKCWEQQMTNFYRLCKIVDNYLTRELNEKTTEEETKRLLKLIKELRKDENIYKIFYKSEEEI